MLIPVLVALQIGPVGEQTEVYGIQHSAGVADGALILNAGEQVILMDENADGSKPSAQRRPAPLTFTGEPLTRVVAALNRFNSERLVVADEGIRDLKIVGSFEPMPYRGLLPYLKERYGIVAIPLGVDAQEHGVIALARVSVREGEANENHSAIAR